MRHRVTCPICLVEQSFLTQQDAEDAIEGMRRREARRREPDRAPDGLPNMELRELPPEPPS